MMNDDSLPMTIQYTNFYVHMTLSLPYHNNRFIRSKLTLNCNFLFNKVQGTEKIKQIKQINYIKDINEKKRAKLDKKR